MAHPSKIDATADAAGRWAARVIEAASVAACVALGAIWIIGIFGPL